MATSQAAQSEAQRSENAMVEHLRTLSAGRYLQPGALVVDSQEAVSHASLDAHIKKVQAEQIQQLNAQQLAQLQIKTKTDFLNRRVRITVINNQSNPVESLWFDPRSGYRNSPNNRRIIQGTIEDILLDKNAIVIKPNPMLRMINNSLKAFIIYVIDPQTFTPTVEITVI
jgi:hypothetical protein